MTPQNSPAELLKEFLSEHRESKDSGFAPVTEQDMQQLYELMHAIVTAKWSPDCDGDRPINFDIIDRTRFEPMHWAKTPYRHHAECMENRMAANRLLEDILDSCVTNVRTAAARLDTEIRVRQYYRREEEKHNATFQKGQELVCVEAPEDCLTVGQTYIAKNYSYWATDGEKVSIDADGRGFWYGKPVEYFTAKEKHDE